MARPLPQPHLPPRSPKPSFPAWISTAWYTIPAITQLLRTTQPTVTAPQRKMRPCPVGATAARHWTAWLAAGEKLDCLSGSLNIITNCFNRSKCVVITSSCDCTSILHNLTQLLSRIFTSIVLLCRELDRRKGAECQHRKTENVSGTVVN